jgi:hypothetical protein
MSTASEQFIYSEELYKLPSTVIVLLPVPWETLSDDQITLLRKILGSVRLTIEGVQILCRKQADLNDLSAFNPLAVISFGVALNPKSELYQSTQVGDVQVIQSDELAALDDTKKKSLWNALKQVFVP